MDKFFTTHTEISFTPGRYVKRRKLNPLLLLLLSLEPRDELQSPNCRSLIGQIAGELVFHSTIQEPYFFFWGKNKFYFFKKDPKNT